MELITKLRAKSPEKCETSEEMLLVGHTIHLLKKVEQLKDFIEKNKGYIDYKQIKDEEFFVALSVAAILHDLGKINYKYQKTFYKKNFNLELKNFLKQIVKIDVMHKILSSIWAYILLDDSSN